jgi:hypothetical protein
MSAESFIEVDSCQCAKDGQSISGDVFLSEKVKEDGRIVSVLSNGRGSGVKASVLATMTATMALSFMVSRMDICDSGEVIMDALPVINVRKASYSTFTIVDMASTGETRIVEHANPPFLLVRPGHEVKVEKTALFPKRWKERVINHSSFNVQREDRIVFFSEGLTQAGASNPSSPVPWGLEGVDKFVRQQISKDPSISARELSRRLVARALELDGRIAQDDITCGVVYFRSPRQLLVLTGPPFNRSSDRDLAAIVEDNPGRKVICGGTTANILAGLLKRTLQADHEQSRDAKVPMFSRMRGFELVTEGALTLGEVLRLLEMESIPEQMNLNGAALLLNLLLDSDIVKFVVGTSINLAYHDPTFPVELDLRRNIVKQIARLLETRYMKRIAIQYI